MHEDGNASIRSVRGKRIFTIERNNSPAQKCPARSFLGMRKFAGSPAKSFTTVYDAECAAGSLARIRSRGYIICNDPYIRRSRLVFSSLKLGRTRARTRYSYDNPNGGGRGARRWTWPGGVERVREKGGEIEKSYGVLA